MGAAVHRFTPHHYLVALVADPRRLALSPGARTVLGAALWKAGKTGEGEGCHEGDAMFVRRVACRDRDRTAGDSLAGELGMSRWAVQRAIAELATAGLFRVRYCRPGEVLPRLPSGRPGWRVTEGTVAVFYVDIVRLRALFGLGTERAKSAVSQRSRALCGSTETTQFPGVFGAPLTKTPVVIATDDTVVNQEILTTTTTGERRPTHPPCGGGFEIPPEIAPAVESLFATWWTRIGRRRHHSDTPPPRTRRGVQSAIADAIAEGYTAAQLEAAIAARGSREIGGAAYDFCEAPPQHPDRPIWAAGMFTGSLDFLIRCAGAYEARERSRATAASANDRDGGRALAPAEPSTRPRVAQVAADDLRALIGVDPEPAWLGGRQGATVVDGDRAAFRPRR